MDTAQFRGRDWRLTTEGRQTCLGTARLKLSQIHFAESPWRPDEQQLYYLREKFHKAKLERLKPRNHLKAIVSRQSLAQALRHAGIEESILRNPDPTAWPVLDFPNKEITSLQGRYRVELGRELLPPGDQWWAVDLYPPEISTELQDDLREEYANEVAYSDGEIYYHIGRYHELGDYESENKWWSRLSGKKEKKVRAMMRNDNIRPAMDRLRAIPALWNGIYWGKWHKIEGTHCDESIIRYFGIIWDLWGGMFNFDLGLLRQIQAEDVKALQGLAPGSSSEDHETARVLFEGRAIFKAFRQVDVDRAWHRVRTYKWTIPTLLTFFKDILILEKCAAQVQKIITKPRRGTIYSTMNFMFGAEGEEGQSLYCRIQTSEQTNRQIRCDDRSLRFEICYRQVWLSTIRHCLRGKRSRLRNTPNAVHDGTSALKQIATLALDLGFRSHSIDSLISRDVPPPLSRQETEHHEHNIAVSGYPKQEDRYGIPHATTLREDCQKLFLDTMHQAPMRRERVTSFLVLQSQYIRFFGELPTDVPGVSTNDGQIPSRASNMNETLRPANPQTSRQEAEPSTAPANSPSPANETGPSTAEGTSSSHFGASEDQPHTSNSDAQPEAVRISSPETVENQPSSSHPETTQPSTAPAKSPSAANERESDSPFVSSADQSDASEDIEMAEVTPERPTDDLRDGEAPTSGPARRVTNEESLRLLEQEKKNWQELNSIAKHQEVQTGTFLHQATEQLKDLSEIAVQLDSDELLLSGKSKRISLVQKCTTQKEGLSVHRVFLEDCVSTCASLIKDLDRTMAINIDRGPSNDHFADLNERALHEADTVMHRLAEMEHTGTLQRSQVLYAVKETTLRQAEGRLDHLRRDLLCQRISVNNLKILSILSRTFGTNDISHISKYHYLKLDSLNGDLERLGSKLLPSDSPPMNATVQSFHGRHLVEQDRAKTVTNDLVDINKGYQDPFRSFCMVEDNLESTNDQSCESTVLHQEEWILQDHIKIQNTLSQLDSKLHRGILNVNEIDRSFVQECLQSESARYRQKLDSQSSYLGRTETLLQLVGDCARKGHYEAEVKQQRIKLAEDMEFAASLEKDLESTPDLQTLQRRKSELDVKFEIAAERDSWQRIIDAAISEGGKESPTEHNFRAATAGLEEDVVSANQANPKEPDLGGSGIEQEPLPSPSQSERQERERTGQDRSSNSLQQELDSLHQQISAVRCDAKTSYQFSLKARSHMNHAFTIFLDAGISARAFDDAYLQRTNAEVSCLEADASWQMAQKKSECLGNNVEVCVLFSQAQERAQNVFKVVARAETSLVNAVRNVLEHKVDLAETAKCEALDETRATTDTRLRFDLDGMEAVFEEAEKSCEKFDLAAENLMKEANLLGQAGEYGVQTIEQGRDRLKQALEKYRQAEEAAKNVKEKWLQMHQDEESLADETGEAGEDLSDKNGISPIREAPISGTEDVSAIQDDSIGQDSERGPTCQGQAKQSMQEVSEGHEQENVEHNQSGRKKETEAPLTNDSEILGQGNVRQPAPDRKRKIQEDIPIRESQRLQISHQFKLWITQEHNKWELFSCDIQKRYVSGFAALLHGKGLTYLSKVVKYRPGSYTVSSIAVREFQAVVTNGDALCIIASKVANNWWTTPMIRNYCNSLDAVRLQEYNSIVWTPQTQFDLEKQDNQFRAVYIRR
ncbi:uncharacterized protein KD926_003767 [Aspergillus affinis]|uniref:uncharacterized protein n=1 Tax=Aspergillus affinis TaxID=1070780 RepID=UPI0022FEAE16|nr:uncharacterized protein KD926_003767 [Aspergillus affinis]KAI9035295.1 hypothetical protein KD926_003767 [Aspergillus affinis]